MILVISYPGEEHTDDVVERLQRDGCEVVRIDLADFPLRQSIAASWSDADGAAFVVEQGGRTVDLRTARAVWWRRVMPFGIDPGLVGSDHGAFAASETGQAVYGMLDSLACPWMNAREADAAAHHKPYQWTVAHELGLRLPRTLVTTDADAARRFIDDGRPGRTVFKPFLASISEWRETRWVEDEDLERLALVRHAPVIFQQYVPGVDLRITVVGDAVFAAAIDARGTSYEVDMRMVVGEAKVYPVILPRVVHDKLLALQRRLGLVYGAIDMRLTDAGDYVFLEVNPAGQWHFVEHRTGLPIGQAVADHLRHAAGPAGRQRAASARDGRRRVAVAAGEHHADRASC